MWKFLLVFLVVLVACSERTPPASKSNRTKAATAQGVTTTPTTSFEVATDSIHIPLKRDKVSAEAKEVFLDFYGGAIWSNINIGLYFKDKTEGYVTPKFEGRFTEGGIKKLLVLGYITPEPLDDFVCHACVPLIGGAVFVQQDSKWVVESAQKIIGRGDILETGDFSLVQIGPDNFGVSIHIEDAHQGYEDNKYEILVPYQGNLTVALVDGFYEKPGDAACIDDNVELPRQNLSIKFVVGKNSEYFNVILRARYNDGECQHWVRKEHINRYQFQDGEFKPI